MDIVDRIVEKRTQILDLCARYGARNVRVFGSCARDDYTEGSDVDILVNLDEGLTGFEYFGVIESLREDLEELLGTRVDVVDEKGLRKTIREDVLSDAVAL
ncbi:MAG TPA: nucleotidyltransferase family protein [Candidatus Obscuribacterales bacterium]